MSGFSSIIGFMFSFFVIVGVFFSAFVMYQEQVKNQIEVRDFSSNKLDINLNLNFDLARPFVYSGMVGFNINNLGSKDFIIKDSNGVNCVDIYINSNSFLDKKDEFFAPLYDLSKNYKVIKSGKSGVLFIKGYNLSQIKSLKLISCEGKIFEFNFQDVKLDYWNNDWLLRKDITVTNNFADNLNEYQVEVNLNNSNFDFSKANENSLRIVYNLGENLVLDLPLNENFQKVNDYSKYKNKLYLGSAVSVESSDPRYENNSLLFGGFNFDGSNDAILVKANKSLLIDNQVSMFAWVKWGGSGNNLQNIYTNGAWYNAIRIVNDGSANQNKVLFQLNIGGTVEYLYSNTLIDNSWHFIGATYDGDKMRIYIDGKLDSVSASYSGFINTNYGDNYIGTEGGNYFFNGSLDEIKLFDVALNDKEVGDLYYNLIDKKVMDYYIVDFDKTNQKGKIFVKIPRVLNNSYTKIGLYYNYQPATILNSNSDINHTFSYSFLRKIGVVLNNRLSSTTGIKILSLENNNNVTIGSNSYILNERQGASIASGNLNLGDNVSLKYLAQVEGSGDYTDIISPISWAGKEFYYAGFRSANDKFCMQAPWVNANVELYDKGTLLWSGGVNKTVNCQTVNVVTSNALRIKSDSPIIVAYDGIGDAFNLYPAISDDLYGVPSTAFYVGAGPNGSNINVYKSSSSILSYSLTFNGSLNLGGGGSQGTAPAFRVSTSGNIGAIQQADSDGYESTVFVPRKEFGTKFGSNLNMDYIAVASNFFDANCSVYDSTGTLVGNVLNGVGSNGIYKYDFSTGNNILYASAGWELKCDKTVWPYYEKSTYNDETNLLGYLQMRQYVYPEPKVVIKN